MDFNIIQGQSSTLTYTASPEGYACTLSVAVTAAGAAPNLYVNKGLYLLKISTTNSDTRPTLNINGIGAQTIVKNGSTSATTINLNIGDLIANTWAYFLWDQSIGGGGGAFIYVCCSEVDTGWIDLSGFSFMTNKPQYRVIGRTLLFRGQAAIPLDNGAGSVIPFVNEASYIGQQIIAPFTGSGGVTVNSAGSITFNNGTAVLPAAYWPDNTYQVPYSIIVRRILAQADASNAITYTATVTIFITTSGTLVLQTLFDVEEYQSTQPVGFSPLRFLNSNVIAGQYSLNLRDVVIGNTLFGNAANATLTLAINTVTGPTLQHAITMDTAKPEQIGGFIVIMDQLKGFLAP